MSGGVSRFKQVVGTAIEEARDLLAMVGSEFLRPGVPASEPFEDGRGAGLLHEAVAPELRAPVGLAGKSACAQEI